MPSQNLKISVLMEGAEKISAPFRRASGATDALKTALKSASGEVRALERSMGEVEGFARLKRESQANAAALAAAQAKTQALGRELAATDNPSKKLQSAFAAARREVQRLEAAEVSIAGETNTLRQRLGAAGIDTKQLASAQRTLKRDLDAARQAAAKQAAGMKALADAREKMERTKAAAGNLAIKGGVAAGAGALALRGGQSVVDPAGDLQHQLAAYGLTAGIGSEALAKLRLALRGLSVDVNQTAPELLDGLSILVGKGMDPDAALTALRTIGRAVTGTGAQMADMSGLAFSVMDNLKVPAEEVGKEFDIMAKAGDLGGFELKDMATYFPQLTSSAYQLGMTGSDAIGTLSAALQVATRGAASTSEAANNMANFLKAATAETAVKNFREKGINIKKAMQKGILEGKNPFDILMTQTGKALGVNLEKEVENEVSSGVDRATAAARVASRFKLGELFADAQAQNFLAPMLANMGEFRRIREQALDSAGTVDQKFATMMNTYNEVKKGLGSDVSNSFESIGAALLPVLIPSLNTLRSIVQGVSGFAEANPRLTATLATVAGGLALVVAGGGALAIAIAGLMGPFAMLRFAMAAMGLQGVGLFGGLLTGIKLVGAAFLTNPIGLAITAIIAGFTLLYATFEPFRNLVDSVFGKVKELFGFGGAEIPTVSTAPAAAMAAAGGGGGSVTNVGGVTINATPGMSEKDLAQAFQAEVERMKRQQKTDARSALSDGVY